MLQQELRFSVKAECCEQSIMFSSMHFCQMSVTFCYWINFLSGVMLAASSGLGFSNCVQQQSPSYEAQSPKKFPVTWWVRLFITLLTVADIPLISWVWHPHCHTTPLELIWIHPSSLHLCLAFASAFFPAGCRVPILFALIFFSWCYMPYPSHLS
jgi:hypothetical protein